MAPLINIPSPHRESLTLRQTVANYAPGHTFVQKHSDYEYEGLKPCYPNVKCPTLKEVAYYDKGMLGDTDFSNLKEIATEIVDYSPKVGTEVRGVDLANLTGNQKNDIARLVATRGVVFFRDQKNFDVEAQRKLGTYFGPLHEHATAALPRHGGLEDVLVEWRDENSKDHCSTYTPTFLWHIDVTYEIQPPSYTSLKLLTNPPQGGGGDTVWSSQYAAYDALSGPVRKYLSSLKALHSSKMQHDDSIAQERPVRRDPITTAHPCIRSHPVTGWRSLFFNPGFVTSIVGVPKLESDAIIAYLNSIIVTTQEMHVRFQWQKDDVALWDNRTAASRACLPPNHTASYGFAPYRRHALLVACHSERPYLDPNSGSQAEHYAELYGTPLPNKYGSAQTTTTTELPYFLRSNYSMIM